MIHAIYVKKAACFRIIILLRYRSCKITVTTRVDTCCTAHYERLMTALARTGCLHDVRARARNRSTGSRARRRKAAHTQRLLRSPSPLTDSVFSSRQLFENRSISRDNSPPGQFCRRERALVCVCLISIKSAIFRSQANLKCALSSSPLDSSAQRSRYLSPKPVSHDAHTRVKCHSRVTLTRCLSEQKKKIPLLLARGRDRGESK